MKKSILAVTLFASCAGGALLMSPAAGAQQPAPSPWYVGAGIGQSRYDFNIEPSDRKDTAYNLNGGYWLAPNVALEIGYSDFGKGRYGDSTAKVNTGYGAVVLNAPIAERFALFGKLGYGSTKLENSRPSTTVLVNGTLVTDVGFSHSERQSEALYGLGASYSFTRNITGTLEWQRLDKSKLDAGFAGVRFAF